MRFLSGLALGAALVGAATSVLSEDGTSGVRGYTEVRGSKIYIETFGSGAPLVFLHGGLLYFDNSFAKQRDYFQPPEK